MHTHTYIHACTQLYIHTCIHNLLWMLFCFMVMRRERLSWCRGRSLPISLSRHVHCHLYLNRGICANASRSQHIVRPPRSRCICISMCMFIIIFRCTHLSLYIYIYRFLLSAFQWVTKVELHDRLRTRCDVEGVHQEEIKMSALVGCIEMKL